MTDRLAMIESCLPGLHRGTPEPFFITDIDWLVAEVKRLRQLAQAARREEQRHIREVDRLTVDMDADKQQWYRLSHLAACDLAGSIAFATGSTKAEIPL